MASTNVLTSLMNRRAVARRLAGAESGFVLIMNADHFKRINDSFGHADDDQCLRVIADRLHAVPPEAANVARIGGEEFGLHLNCASEVFAARGACISGTVLVDQECAVDATLQMKLSVDVAQTWLGDTLKQTMNRADHAMHRAKQAGRARIVISCRAKTDTPEVSPAGFGGQVSPAIC